MGLRRRKRRIQPGAEEYIALALFAGATVCAILWWSNSNGSDWLEATGYVLQCDIQSTHYNAQDYAPKVRVAYEYNVGSADFLGNWTGFWPDNGSPNAIPPNKVSELLTKGFPLTVFYDPYNPSVSRIDGSPALTQPSGFFGVLALGLFTLAFLYCFRIYPILRQAHSHV